MGFQTKYITPEIKLSSYSEKLCTTEVLFDHHMLIWFISGETKIVKAEATYLFNPGDIFLIPRNQMATIILDPKDGLPHKSVAMHLSTSRLKNFYSDLNVDQKGVSIRKILRFNNHPLLESCLTSLIPYFDLEGTFPEDIASLKITEAISILRVIDKSVDGLLANFEEPGKIDLGTFMEKNYMFNMPLEKFAYLTGRSLTTFKRDFQKAFNLTPQKWLTEKRLELAYYQFVEKKKKPVDVYFEVGFENLSHFSFAFKKQYGYSPSVLIEQRSTGR
ncbi:MULTISPECIES: AraC family transcriptional regulator [Fluviicola]|uniref:AraC family transcriptional regulator n=1 Tax=Fluviicola TaxID=332102 RepID=UPI00313831FA